jgi:hypothetical protein
MILDGIIQNHRDLVKAAGQGAIFLLEADSGAAVHGG